MSTTEKMKKVLTGNTSKETAETALFIFSSTAKRQHKIHTTMDAEINLIRQKYLQELSDLNTQKIQAFETLQRYAENNRDAFAGKKSIALKNGILGFRTGMPKLKTLKGYSWSSVVNLLKIHLPDYVRTVEEPAKSKLLADRLLPEVGLKFKELGICIDQDETFFVESQSAI
ncbi:host-nuclease inhibitor Gam family protein [Niabella pedocola]|uniref:Host-nuclease inhibitor Gam family protein n=1 Tax=Niabella pedocola TaxID=1752077 RepID=A0ABS8PTT1_9BACT|nr:host-nuclease inhibitor Gam family protein [Niabella pedocola]MCD2424475.1 host-nuclease inhibitor Gam family protein [Niabella pedocola]